MQWGEHTPENLGSAPVRGSWEGCLTGFEPVLDNSEDGVREMGSVQNRVSQKFYLGGGGLK